MAVVHSQGVGDGDASGHPHQTLALPELPSSLVRHERHRSSAIADGRTVHHVDGRSHGWGFFIACGRELDVEHGVGVGHPVFVSDDGEGREIGLAHAVFVHVTAHDHGVKGDEGRALRGLVILIRGHGQARSGLRGQGVGHLLHPSHDDRIHHAAGHCQHAHAHRSRARGAGRLDLGRLDASQAREIGDERGQMLLAAELAREHIAHVERVCPLDARVRHSRADRVIAQMAQGFIPQLAHGRLSDANDCNVSHETMSFCFSCI